MQKMFREPMNGATHFIGIVLSVIGLIALLNRLNGQMSLLHLISFSIFGGAMILLYTFSSLYHWLPLAGRRLEVFRKIDHIMIFVFIAATYTPVCLVTLHGAWGWSILGSVWGLTLAGFFMKLFWLRAPRWLYTAIYVLMGWLIVVGIWPLSQAMVPQGIFLMVLGGIFYTIGAVIYALKKPDFWPRVFGFHAIFHLLIILGSLAHFWMIYLYV